MVNQTDSLDSSWVNLGTEENQEIAKDHRYSGDSGIEEKEEFEVLNGENQKIQANLCDTPSEDLSLENAILTNFPDDCDRSFTVESKDEDSEERRPYVLGSNKSEIAGFSQEKLLEIIDFVKIGYYVCDLNYNNGKSSELESRGYKVPGQLRKEGYKVFQFYNMNDGRQYRHAGYVFIKDKEITITYRGSRNGFDYRKDAEMILTSSDELLPKGGKIHSGFYSLFKDSWSSVYEILKGHANDQQLEIKDFKINLTGHSMGGAIANIAALCLSVTEGAEDLHVATFASPRVFDSSAAEIYKERLGKKTIRVVNQSDFIPSLPFGSMGYKHVGEQLVITSHCSLQRAHLLDTYRNLIANIEPGQFKSDNSVSIYYYPSYLAAVLYNVFTAPSYLILNIHSNDDEQYFTQVKNKHKGASLSEMMKYSGSNNEQKVVIYEDYEPSENGFITFHILRNAIGEKNLLMIPPTFNPNIEHRITRSLIDNLFAMMPSLHRYGRSKGLKVNLLDTAFFVNDDYYLSGDTISLRLLKTLVDNYPGNLALENANSQRVEDNALALTKKSDIISGMGQKPVRNKSMKSGFMNPIDNYPKPQFDNKIPSTIQIDEVEVGSTITNDQSTSIINSNNTDNVQQESTIVAKESEELAAEISQGISVEDGVTKNDNVQGASTTTTSSDGEDKLPPVQQAIPIVQEELAVQTPPVTLIEDDVAIVSQASTSNDQITPQQESVVLSIGNSTSRALCVATSDAQQVVPRGGTVGTIEALKNLPNNRTIKIFLLNNVQSVAQIFKKSDRDAELSLPNGNTYELDLHLINEESLKVLFNKENSVLANAINDFSTVKVPILEQKSGRNEQAPIQLAGHVIREDSIQVVQPKSLVNIRDNNVQLVNESDQPIQGDNYIALMDQSEDDEHFYDAVESQDTSSEEAQVNSTKGSGKYSSGPEQTLEIFNRHHSNITASTDDGSDEEFMATTANIGDESNQPIPNTASEGDFTLESNSSLQDTQPKTLATTVPVNDTQDNTDQPTSYSEKNDTTSQNTKRSKLTVIAVSTLAITGVATGIAIAVYLEMLAVGIAIGVCCLIAAAVIYYCNTPSNSLENSNAEAVVSQTTVQNYNLK